MKKKRYGCALMQAYLYVTESEMMYTFKSGRRKYMIDITDIVYVRSVGRCIEVISNKEKLSFYGTLKDEYVKLSDLSMGKVIFMQINRSEIVNVKYIKYTDFNTVRLKNNMVLHITKNYKGFVENALLKLSGDNII